MIVLLIIILKWDQAHLQNVKHILKQLLP
jgi:hypothetical protein